MSNTKSVIRIKSFAFAIRIVKVYKYIRKMQNEYVLSKQLLRSGTAIGALVREAQNAESAKDFIHKLAIAQKECDETCYWLELLQATDYLTVKQFSSVAADADELLRMIRSSILTMKAKLKNT